MSVSRTINPLHFEDLEPHRFEDLIRQLIYDFRDWKSIEATGKMGSDDGIDILAIENVLKETTDDEDNDSRSEERTWIIQCKREQKLTPKKINDIINNDLSKQNEIPHGYILVASSNFSKKSRDVFKSRLNELGINEFYIYGKAELEDLIFLPKYDHLLFAYFGISLQKRKRTVKSNLSARLTTKRKLINILGGFDEVENKIVFIKPSESYDYPIIRTDKELIWRYYESLCYAPIDSISLITKKYFAYINWEKEEWDIIENYDYGFPNHPQLHNLSEEYYRNLNEQYQEAWEMWHKLDESNKSFYIEFRPIHFDRILLVDEIGDCYHEPPHLTVDYINNSPFEGEKFIFIVSTDRYSSKRLKDPKIEKRIKIFK